MSDIIDFEDACIDREMPDMDAMAEMLITDIPTRAGMEAAAFFEKNQNNGQKARKLINARDHGIRGLVKENGSDE